MNETHDTFEAHVFSSPLPIINFEHKYNFFWNAKCGCTLATLIFLEHCNFDCDSFPSEVGKIIRKAQHKRTHPNHIHECRTAYNKRNGVDYISYKHYAVNSKFKNFKLVRNPFNRVVSGYFMFMRDAMAKQLASVIEESALDFMPHALTMAGKKHATELSFLDFCRTLASLDVETCNIHFMQQTHPLEISGEMIIDRILKLETFNDSIRDLNREFGLDIDIESYVHRSFPHHQPADINVPSMQKISRLRYMDYAESSPHKSAFYCDETQELVESIYKVDLANYDYTFPFALAIYLKSMTMS